MKKVSCFVLLLSIWNVDAKIPARVFESRPDGSCIMLGCGQTMDKLVHKSLESRSPISAWPIYEHLTTDDERTDFKELPTESDGLTKLFLNNCCRFGTSAVRLIFGGKINTLSPLTDHQKSEWIESINKIARNPVGNELIRIICTKFVANRLDDSQKLVILSSSLDSVGSYFTSTSEIKNLFAFSESEFSVGVIKMESQGLSRFFERFPKHIHVFHECVHWLHSLEGYDSTAPETGTITQRHLVHETFSHYYLETVKGLSVMPKSDLRVKGEVITIADALRRLYVDDEEYLTMYGVLMDKDGHFFYDPMNESNFTKEFFVRNNHSAYNSETDMRKDQSSIIFDREIIRFYLLPGEGAS